MPTRPSTTDSFSANRTLHEAGLEAFEVIEVHRSQLKGAPYNPRKITDTQKRKLRDGLKRHGLVAPVTWNRRTGNIVGGHQRMSAIDSLMGKSDYTLRVSAIDVDEGREKELNILLNNSMTQGDWDVGALIEMFKDDSIKVEGTGFDLGDVYQIMGEAPFETRSEDTARMAEKLDAVKGLYDTIRDKNKKRRLSDYYLVVVFRTDEQLARFIDAAALPNSRYQNGEKLAEILGVDISESEDSEGSTMEASPEDQG